MTPVTRCSRCHRPLKSGRTIGRRCEAIERAEKREAAIEQAIVPWSQKQKDDAKALITAGKLKPIKDRPGMYRITSRDGKRTYLACALSCPCLARKQCVHMCACVIADTYVAFNEAWKAAA